MSINEEIRKYSIQYSSLAGKELTFSEISSCYSYKLVILFDPFGVNEVAITVYAE